MKIVTFPHPSLLKKASKVTVFGPEIKLLLDKMYETMKLSGGIGLAANQVELPFSMFVMDGPDGPLYFVNPKIVWKSKAMAQIREGCLSAPGEAVVIARAAIIKIEFQDETGEKKMKIFNDIYSICAQHETDHLDGKAFLEHHSLTKVQRNQLKSKWGVK